MIKIEEWIQEIDPHIDVHVLQTDAKDQLVYLHVTLWIEPELQVRMTGTSAAYMPKPVAYNGWKRCVSHKLKAVLHKVAPSLERMPGLVKSTMFFHVSNRHRWQMGDLNNHVKATEDMLNQCSHIYTEDEIKRWPDMTKPLPVWVDDRKVKRNGDHQGVYWVERNPRIEIILEAISLPGPVSSRK